MYYFILIMLNLRNWVLSMFNKYDNYIIILYQICSTVILTKKENKKSGSMMFQFCIFFFQNWTYL